MFKTNLFSAGLVFTCLLISGHVLYAQNTTSLKVDTIVKKANHMSLYQGDDLKGNVNMLITDKQGRVSKREFKILRKDSSKNDSDQKYFTYFQTPADLRKMIFMVHKHSSENREDARWLYMPSLDLVKRIAASDKRTSFAGSDFLYEDISGRNIIEDAHQLIEMNDKYYVIKNTPLKPKSVEFSYYIAYVDKKTFIPMKINYFKSNHRLYRSIEVNNVEIIKTTRAGKEVLYPTVVKSTAKDFGRGTSTVMMFTNVHYNIGLKDAIFTERFLRRPPREITQ